MQINADRIGWA